MFDGRRGRRARWFGVSGVGGQKGRGLRRDRHPGYTLRIFGLYIFAPPHQYDLDFPAYSGTGRGPSNGWNSAMVLPHWFRLVLLSCTIVGHADMVISLRHPLGLGGKKEALAHTILGTCSTSERLRDPAHQPRRGACFFRELELSVVVHAAPGSSCSAA